MASSAVRNAYIKADIERQFEIIGEALGHLVKVDPEAAGRISDYRRIIAFRNILIHGYAGVDDVLVTCKPTERGRGGRSRSARTSRATA